VTDPASTAARRFDDVDDVYALLRSEGHRVTAPLRFVLAELFDAEGPISAQRISASSPGAGLQPSSVYRALERLEELGVVRHVHLGHGPSLYLLVGSGEREFLLCERCGAVRSVDPAELDSVREAIERRFGYRARFGHFPIVGVCAECAAAGRAGS
jgi:Fur family transcriptional regulator, ferric uptake regulator